MTIDDLVVPFGNRPKHVSLWVCENILFTLQVAGVQVNANGYSWLQSVTVNQKVKFLPLLKKDDHVECQVLLLNTSAQNVSEFFV